jgi:hypothetical protein
MQEVAALICERLPLVPVRRTEIVIGDLLGSTTQGQRHDLNGDLSDLDKSDLHTQYRGTSRRAGRPRTRRQ